MKFKHILFIPVIFFLMLQMNAQNKPYNFFSEGNNGILYFEVGYANETLSNVMNRGNGITFDFGLNLAYFINKKYILAPYAGIRTVWGEKYTSDFIMKLNNGTGYPINYQDLLNKQNDGTITDEERIELNSLDQGLARLDCLKEGIIDGGCLTMYYGIVLKPPFIYFPPIKLYKLQTNSSMKRPSIWENRSNYFHYPRNGWGVEIVLSRGRLLTKDDRFGHVGIGSIHLFFETADIQRTRLLKGEDDSYEYFITRDVYLDEFTNNTFKSDFSKEWRAGFKIAFTYM